MSNYSLDSLRCVYCKGRFEIFEVSKEASILHCSCSDFPFIEGIIYFRKDRARKKAITLLREGDERRAVLTLLNTQHLLLFPIYFLFLSSFLDSLVLRTFNKHIYQVVGFEKFIRVLTLFSYPKSWARYLLNRKKDISYKLSVFATKMFNYKDQVVLDFGCGVGHLIPTLLKKMNPKNLYAIDNSFLSLLIARRYFSYPEVTLICMDAELGLPFINETLNILIASDSFHYVKKKSYFLGEASRALTKSGLLSIIHTINSSKTVYGNILGIKTKEFRLKLKSVGFKKINIYNDDELWEYIRNKSPINLNKIFFSKIINEKDAYTVFAAKGRFPEIV